MENVVLQSVWGWPIACYLFLGGLAAGALVVSCVLFLKGNAVFSKSVRFGAWAGAICLALGILCLVFEVGMPLRALVMWEAFSAFGSWMTIGAWLLFVGIILSGVFALSQTAVVTDKLGFLKKLAKPLAIIIIPVAAFIAVYTGILLSVLIAHPLWNSWLLPVLFTVSALDTGLALMTLYGTVRLPADNPDVRAYLKASERLTVGLVVAELVVLAALLIVVNAEGELGTVSVWVLTSGPLALPFWGVLVVCGLVVPGATALFALKGGKGAAASAPATPAADASAAVAQKRAANPALIAIIGCSLCLLGGFALRALVLLAG